MQLRNKHNKPGFVLLMALMMLSVLTMIVTRVFYKQSAYSGFSSTVLDAQKAKQLALSGVQVAISRMSIPPVEVKEGVEEKQLDKALGDKFLMRIFPILNLWQQYKFPSDSPDEDEGIVNYVIASEDGKLNLNQIYNINQTLIRKSGTEEAEEGLASVANFLDPLKTYLPEGYLGALQEDFNKRKYPYNDVSQLLTIPQFDTYFKNKLVLDRPETEAEENQLYLADLFTIFSNTGKVQPLLLSHSLIKMLGLNLSNDPDERRAVLEEVLKTEPPPESATKEEKLKAEWENLFRPIYGAEYDSLPQNYSYILDPELMPEFFSVVSSAKVGKVTKKLYAILQLRIIGDNELSFDVIKLYWIS